MAAFGGAANGFLALAGSGGLTPARLLLVPAGTRLPPGVHPVAAVPARAMGLLARGAAGAGHGITSTARAYLAPVRARAYISIGDGDADADADATKEGVLLSVSGATREGVLASIPVDDVTKEDALASLAPVRARAYLSIGNGDATREGVLASLPVDDVASLPAGAHLPAGMHAVVTEVVAVPGGSGSRATGLVARAAGMVTTGTGAAAAGPARRAAGLLFLHGDASSAGLGISSAALASASAAGGRGGRVVVAATTGSEADAGVDNGKGSTADQGFYEFITNQALAALGMLDALVLPTAKDDLATMLKLVKTDLTAAVILAREGHPHPDKMVCVLFVVRACYAMLELVHTAYPRAKLPVLPDEKDFVDICLAAGHDEFPPVILGHHVAPLLRSAELPGLEVSHTDADLMKGVLIAVGVAMGTARSASDDGGSAGAAVCV